MQLSRELIQSTSGYAGPAIKRQIDWRDEDGNPASVDVWVRKLSFHSAVSGISALASQDDVVASRIVACIVDEDGRPIFEKISDVTGVDEDGTPVMIPDGEGNLVERGGLDEELAAALMAQIMEVNRLGKPKASD